MIYYTYCDICGKYRSHWSTSPSYLDWINTDNIQYICTKCNM